MNFSRQDLNSILDEKSIYEQKESPDCIACTIYILDCGLSGNLTKLDAGLIPCFVGYSKVADYITQNNLRVANNQCQSWIEKTYKKTNGKNTRYFTTAIRMEISFCQMGLDLSKRTHKKGK